MDTTKTRVDFKLEVKRKVAGRAGYRCSFPGCGKPTIGPGNGPHEIATIGVAAHIFSASRAGPRGQGSLTAEELGSIDNAIWLCEIHGKLVDNNRGTKFPDSLLLTYKDLHEARISREMGDSVSPFGWIEQLELKNNPLFLQPAVIRLAKANVLVGAIGTGKTALCEWIAGTLDSRSMGRWQPRKGKTALEYVLTYSDIVRHTVGISVLGSTISFEVDGRITPYNPLPFSIVMLRVGRRRKEMSTVRRLALQLGVEPLVIRNLASEIDNNPSGPAKNVTIRGNDIVSVDVDGTRPGLPYDLLSHYEKLSVDLEFAIALARGSSFFGFSSNAPYLGCSNRRLRRTASATVYRSPAVARVALSDDYCDLERSRTMERLAAHPTQWRAAFGDDKPPGRLRALTHKLETRSLFSSDKLLIGCCSHGSDRPVLKHQPGHLGEI